MSGWYEHFSGAIFLALIFFLSPVVAQKKESVSISDLSMSQYDRDSTAAAVYLYDRGELRVEPTFVQGTVLRRSFQIKIFKPAGLQYANFKIVGRRSSVQNIRGATWSLLNGKVTKSVLKNEMIFTKHLTDKLDEVLIVFPAVGIGSVLECSYEIARDKLFLLDWNFQYEIPVVQSEYQLTSPTWGQQAHLRGVLPFTREESQRQGTVHRWTMKDVPAFHPEPLMPDSAFWRSRLTFTTGSSSWEEVYKKLWTEKSFRAAFTYHNFDGVASSLTDSEPDSLMKIKRIVQWIKKSIAWNGEFKTKPGNLRDVEKFHRGSSADINLILTLMLRKAGFDADVVFISTRSNGFIADDIPSADFFNSILCETTVGGKQWMLDATDKYLSFDRLPVECLNHKGFLVGDEFYGWRSIESTKISERSLTGVVTLNADESITGDLLSRETGYFASASRRLRDSLGTSAYLRTIAGKNQWTIRNASFDVDDDPDGSLEERYDVKVESWVTGSGSTLLVNPFSFLQTMNRTFASAERKYPVDFPFSGMEHWDLTLAIPAGFRLDHLPASHRYSLSDESLSCDLLYSFTGDRIHMEFRLTRARSFFEADEYPNLRELYRRIAESSLDNIVLSKNDR